MIVVTDFTFYGRYADNMKKRTIYTTMTIGSAMGMAAAFLQIVEKITLLKDKNAILTCDLNSVFSCSTVLSAWQSSVFGFPNSIMCLTLFTVFGAISLVGATKGVLSRQLRLGIQTLSLATLVFALWFIEQSIYSIGSLCVLCIFCLAGLFLVNWGWLRLNAADLPIGRRGRVAVAHVIAKDYDVFAWIILALIVASAMILRFS